MDEYHLDKLKKYFTKDYSHKAIIAMLKKKYNITISLRTLSRICIQNGLRRKNLKVSPIEEVKLAVLLELEGSGSNLGYKSMWKRIRRVYGLTVKQKTVMKVLKELDPEGVDARSRYRLKRRVYSVPGPNHIWHTDGHDKLKPFGFAIYGAIDGFSRKIIWLDVASTNNDPKVILYYYLKTIKKLGFLPTLIRTDNGSEVKLMECAHMALRSKDTDECAGINSFLKGKSTFNQRIECYWRQLRQKMCDFYIALFKNMVSDNLIDTSNPIHIDCLRFCFGNFIKEDLLIAKKEWNEHRIRKQYYRDVMGGIPNEIYHNPEVVGATDYRKTVNNLHIDILMDTYAKKPKLHSDEFSKLVDLMMPNLSQPSCIEEAFNLYLTLIDKISKI